MVSYANDLASADQPFDPLLLMCLAPTLLAATRTVFLVVPPSDRSISVFVLHPPVSHSGSVSTGFILLFQHHAWLVAAPAQLSSPLLQASGRHVGSGAHPFDPGGRMHAPRIPIKWPALVKTPKPSGTKRVSFATPLTQVFRIIYPAPGKAGHRHPTQVARAIWRFLEGGPALSCQA